MPDLPSDSLTVAEGSLTALGWLPGMGCHRMPQELTVKCQRLEFGRGQEPEIIRFSLSTEPSKSA
jgi:hypothetical protein